MNEAMEKLKKEKTKLWVFAEGYRNHSGSIDEFKRGAFHMAIQSQVPIVPVVFSSYKLFMRKNEKIFDSGDVIIEALPEISTIGLTADDAKDLAEKVRDLIVEKYKALNEEVENRSKSKWKNLIKNTPLKNKIKIISKSYFLPFIIFFNC